MIGIGSKISLDTNILIYAFDRAEISRQRMALNVLASTRKYKCVLALQALSEFYAVGVRKKISQLQILSDQIHDWIKIYPVVTANCLTLSRAIRITQKHNLAFWDAFLIATLVESEVKYLLTEDFNQGQLIEGIRIVNPFQENKFWNPDA